MKHISSIFILAFVLLAHTLFAQSKAVISGKISNPLSDEITVVTYPNVLVPEEQEVSVALQNGVFKLEIPVAEATIAELVHGDEVVPVYLEPAYELSLTSNGDKFLKSLKFDGKGANENNYLAQYTLRFDEIDDYQVLPDNIKLREKDFTEFLDYRKKDQLKHLDKYVSKNPVSEKFKAYALAEINFSYANDKISYPALRERIVINDRTAEPSPEFYTFLKNLDLQQPAGLLSTSYVMFLRNYVTHFAQQAGFSENDKSYFKQCYAIARQKLQGKAQTISMVHILKQSIQQGYLKYTNEILQDFTSINKDAALQTYLTNLYNSHKQFALGSPAPDFKLSGINGDTVALSTFKGKLVYLNFWRTNCALCLMDQPHLQELIKKLNNTEVVFLNVALGDSEENWRKAVTTKNLQGVHLHAGSLNTELVKQYDLKDAPAYFLIDEEGGFISAKPRRPNDREFETEILQYLNVKHASGK